MVAFHRVGQYVSKPTGTPAVTGEDVLLFVESDMPSIRGRFANMEFLPPYIGRIEDRALRHHIDGTLGDDAFTRVEALISSSDCLFRKNNELNVARCYECACKFIRIAFELFELSHNPEEHSVNDEVIKALGVVNEHVERGVRVTTYAYNLPACEYLQFISDACDEVRKEPLCVDCFLDPIGDFAPDPIAGWLACTEGAQLIYTTRVPERSGSRRRSLDYLLAFLLDVHFVGVRQLFNVNKPGDYLLVATDALTALWVALRDELGEGGRAGECRVCGRRFIAHDERKEKRRYCSASCQKAFRRTREVLSLINDGMEPSLAAKQIAGISLKRAANIAARNRYVLEKEFKGVDFDALAERR